MSKHLPRLIRVVAPSRLHFGLIAPAAQRGRRFGGVGLMIDKPGIEITVEPAVEWSFTGPLADRAFRTIQKLKVTAHHWGSHPLAVRVHHAPPEHIGLGVGTQLELAIATAVARANDWPVNDAPVLASFIGRGERSAIGVHGFAQGGFLIDGGKRKNDALAPLVARTVFPRNWRIVLIFPPHQAGLNGPAEADVFERLKPVPRRRIGRMCELALLGMLPALTASPPRFNELCEYLYRYNRLAGQAYAGLPAAPYASAQVEDLIAWLRGIGIRGVGQSSWGPAVLALTRSEEEALALSDQLRIHRGLSADQTLMTTASNHGASIHAE